MMSRSLKSETARPAAREQRALATAFSLLATPKRVSHAPDKSDGSVEIGLVSIAPNFPSKRACKKARNVERSSGRTEGRPIALFPCRVTLIFYLLLLPFICGTEVTVILKLQENEWHEHQQSPSEQRGEKSSPRQQPSFEDCPITKDSNRKQ